VEDEDQIRKAALSSTRFGGVVARETGSTIGKMLYGFVFVVVLPLLPIAWASLTKKRVTLPTFELFQSAWSSQSVALP